MKKVIVLLFCLLLTGCSKTYTKELSVREMSQVNLKVGTVITFENDVIILSGRSQEIVDTTECYLDFRECTSEGLCYVSVICDNDEVSVDLPEIYVNAEYYYQRYSEIPEFSNNFTNGEYHASDEYPMLLAIRGYCESVGDIHIGNNWIDCNELHEGYDQTYVEYPIDLMYPNYEHIYRMTYYDAITEPDSYKWLAKPESRHPDYKYIEAEQLELLEEAMEELELVAFYPHYLRYYYNEDGCHNRYYSFMYELDGDEPFALDGDKVVVSVTQYEDLDVAFVSVEAPEYDDSFNAYVKVNDFFKIIDEMMGEANITEYGYGCPIVE